MGGDLFSVPIDRRIDVILLQRIVVCWVASGQLRGNNIRGAVLNSLPGE